MSIAGAILLAVFTFILGFLVGIWFDWLSKCGKFKDDSRWGYVEGDHYVYGPRSDRKDKS